MIVIIIFMFNNCFFLDIKSKSDKRAVKKLLNFIKTETSALIFRGIVNQITCIVKTKLNINTTVVK